MATVSSVPATVLEQVEKESIQQVKTIEKDDESPGLDVTSSPADDVVSDKDSRNDSVPEVDKGLAKDLEKPEEETSTREVAESDAGIIKAEPELKPVEEIQEENQNIESSESLDAVAKGDHVEVKDSSEKIEVPEVAEVIDVGKNEDFSEEKAQAIQELEEKISAEPEGADKIEAVATKDEESSIESGLEPIAIEKPNQEGITTTEEAHVEQSDRDLKPDAEINTESETNRTENVAPHEENEVQKEEDAVVNKEISDVSETEQTSKEIELPADLEGDKDETVAATDKDVIEVEKKVDAEEPHKPEAGTEVAEKIDVDASKDEDNLNEKVAENISTDAEPVATEKITEVPTPEAVEIADAKEQNVAGKFDESSIPEAKGITKETNENELPESEAEVNEVKGITEETNETELSASEAEVNEAKREVAKENLEGIEPSESLDDVAKESSEKIETRDPSVPEASNVELEQSEAEITKAKDLENSGAEDVKNEDLTNEKDETTKELNQESAETNAVDKFEIDGAKDEESLANKVEGFELKSESVPEEPIASTDESKVEAADNIDTEDKNKDTTVVEAKGNSDISETSRDIELPTVIEDGKKRETLATILQKDNDIEVEKKIDAEEPLESEEGTKLEDLSDRNAEITEELKEVVAAESTEKTDIDAAKGEQFVTKEVNEPVEHIDTEPPTSEAEQNIDTKDPIKTEYDNNSIKTSATDVETEEKKEDASVPEAKKIEETTQVSDDVSKVDQTSREIQFPADLESKKGEGLATNEEPQKSKTETIEEEVEENAKLGAPNEESDDVKNTDEATKEEEVIPVKQKQSNNLLSKVKQSLVKAKKAIIKKTPSKTPPTA